jgi:hypothetical protein
MHGISLPLSMWECWQTWHLYSLLALFSVKKENRRIFILNDLALCLVGFRILLSWGFLFGAAC